MWLQWSSVTVGVGGLAPLSVGPPEVPFHGSFDQRGKKGMGGRRFGFELRVILNGHEERMCGQLDDLHEHPIGTGAAYLHPVRGELPAITVVAGWAPRRIVPPLSVISFCSSRRQITG